jgi:hypothetical protein
MNGALHKGNDGDEPPKPIKAESTEFNVFSVEGDEETLKLCIWRKDYVNGTRLWEFTEGPAEEYPEGLGARIFAIFYSGTAAWLFKNVMGGNALDLLEHGDTELFDLS